ncbi:ATP-binding protein [Streptomyces sp. NBC_01381]|uniref:ATP-binding protein n=1 Tax=Streptomyces sp. NBC_01381 TaxID=2903845 RepID=UPI002258454E|nr:ATP-binding protein [Streptomyces sp. NBC_01381]MCX4669475.1 ATP-binding protein [Streptomyces sp. NBC_01381]
MKQSAAKTLGVAALGAAFAAAGAGAANAAPAVPNPTAALGNATSTLPVGEAAATLPAGGPEALAAGQNALGTTMQATAPTVDQLANGHQLANGEVQRRAAALPGAADPLSGLLGGLPVAGPQASGLPVNGLPLG